MTDQRNCPPEILAAFAEEARENVQGIAAGLVELESSPDSPVARATLERVYRQAHTLKGAARVVEMTEVQSICQAVEGVLGAWKRKTLAPDRNQFDILHAAVDKVSRLLSGAKDVAHEAVLEQVRALTAISGDRSFSGRRAPDTQPAAPTPPTASTSASPFPTAEVIHPTRPQTPSPEAPASMLGQGSPLPPGEGGRRPGEGLTTSASMLGQGSPLPPGEGGRRPGEGLTTSASPDIQDSVRVSSHKLELLFRKAEEMLVSRLAAVRRASDARKLRNSLEEWRLELSRVNAALQSVGAVEEVARFVRWNEDFQSRLEHWVDDLALSAMRDSKTFSRNLDSLLDQARDVLLVPVSSLLGAFPKLVRDLSKDLGKDIALVLEGQEVEVDRRVLEQLRPGLIHLVRNACDHGVETTAQRESAGKHTRGTIRIAVTRPDARVVEVRVSDDGRGIDPEAVLRCAIRNGVISENAARELSRDDAIQLVFESDVSTSRIVTDISGRGLGLAVARESAEKVGGGVRIEHTGPAGTTFLLRLPASLATFSGLLVEEAGKHLMIPVSYVQSVLRVAKGAVHTIENRAGISVGGRTLPLLRLGDVLELEAAEDQRGEGETVTVVVVESGSERVALQVEGVLGEQEGLVKPLGLQLERVRNVSGATILASGDLALVLDGPDLVRSSLMEGRRAVQGAGAARGEERRSLTLLVADDSVTSRTLIKNVLEAAGHSVTTAVDGVDAYFTLKAGRFDLLVSDVEMPRMDGFELTEKIRGDDVLKSLPVVLVTGLESREHKEHGIEVGANAYICKSGFDHTNLLAVVERLV